MRSSCLRPVCCRWAARPWPVLLLRQPQPVEVLAPTVLRWQGRAHAIQRIEGPQRLEPEWWHAGPDAQRRDYYRVELASGVRLWICRSGPPGAPRWLLHGHLP